jgi:phosphomannomutase
VDLEIEKAVAQRAVKNAARFKGKRLGGMLVTAVDGMDGVKLLFGDKAWLLVRASGTENLLRLYAEASSRDQVKTLLGAMTAVARRGD